MQDKEMAKHMQTPKGQTALPLPLNRLDWANSEQAAKKCAEKDTPELRS
jgi:hypothetical protein